MSRATPWTISLVNCHIVSGGDRRPGRGRYARVCIAYAGRTGPAPIDLTSTAVCSRRVRTVRDDEPCAACSAMELLHRQPGHRLGHADQELHDADPVDARNPQEPFDR